jgi:hypothetical protein
MLAIRKAAAEASSVMVSTQRRAGSVADTDTGFAGRHSLQTPLPCTIDSTGRAIFDEVAALSVEGMNKSAIARVKGIAWNTMHRWLERQGSVSSLQQSKR